MTDAEKIILLVFATCWAFCGVLVFLKTFDDQGAPWPVWLIVCLGLGPIGVMLWA